MYPVSGVGIYCRGFRIQKSWHGGTTNTRETGTTLHHTLLVRTLHTQRCPLFFFISKTTIRSNVKIKKLIIIIHDWPLDTRNMAVGCWRFCNLIKIVMIINNYFPSTNDVVLSVIIIIIISMERSSS